MSANCSLSLLLRGLGGGRLPQSGMEFSIVRVEMLNSNLLTAFAAFTALVSSVGQNCQGDAMRGVLENAPLYIHLRIRRCEARQTPSINHGGLSIRSNTLEHARNRVKRFKFSASGPAVRNYTPQPPPPVHSGRNPPARAGRWGGVGCRKFGRRCRKVVRPIPAHPHRIIKQFVHFVIFRRHLIRAAEISALTCDRKGTYRRN